MELKPLDYNITIGDLGYNLSNWGDYYIVKISKTGWIISKIGSYSLTGPILGKTLQKALNSID